MNLIRPGRYYLVVFSIRQISYASRRNLNYGLNFLIISLFLIWIASSVYVVWIVGIFFGRGSVTPSIQSWVNILAVPNKEWNGKSGLF